MSWDTVCSVNVGSLELFIGKYVISGLTKPQSMFPVEENRVKNKIDANNQLWFKIAHT